MKANFLEIFSSIQGEGPYVGCRQLFIRFTNCNLDCGYCDTPVNRSPSNCVIEIYPGTKRTLEVKNPLSTDYLYKWLLNWDLSIHHSVSFTGGEPLLNWEFINDFSAIIKKKGIKVFLETNGTLPNLLEKVIDNVDIISMDIKIPGLLVNWTEKLDSDQRKFIHIASQKEVYTKIVVSDKTSTEEFTNAIEIIPKVDKPIPVVIQPVSPMGNYQSPSPERVLTFQQIAAKLHSDVRVIPQTHKQIDQL